jgi:23S rRNA (guanosine2251-2'-O)-methyltransferase
MMSVDIVCGLHAVTAVLKRKPESIDSLWISADRSDRRVETLTHLARSAGIAYHKVSRAELDRLTAGLNHQGAVAQLHPSPVRGERELAPFLSRMTDKPLLLVLDGVQDPHNFGACLRAAEAAGAHAVIVSRDKAAPLSAVARRAASGAAEVVPLFQVPNLARALRELSDAGLWLIGTSLEADTSLFDTDLRGPAGLILGGEGKGLRRLTQEHCDALVRIPMAGSVESLNVSVAAGICLFEAVRQRRSG